MATSHSERTGATPRPPRRWRLAGLAALIVAGAAVLAFRAWRAPVDDSGDSWHDPRLAYTGVFRNVAPTVRYVDDGRCADCHHDIAADYAGHAMGRSLFPIGSAPKLPTAPGDPQRHNPFTALGTRFSVVRDGEAKDGEAKKGEGMVHRRELLAKDGRPLIEQEWRVDHVLGSGARGHSFLTVRDGFIFQTPVSWYGHKQRWDLSPGFSEAHAAGRAVLPDCLFCHVNRAKHVAGSIARYEPPIFEGHAIGCQRCHGPGELHVAARSASEPLGEPDSTIVNPRHVTPALRDAICEQCHLQGETRVPHRGLDFDDFRPGLPAEAFWTVFLRGVDSGKGPKAISHVEQMHASRCFREGQGDRTLSCVSCHDPHRRIAAGERVAFYRERCLTCHAERGCAAPAPARRAREDSCIDCHMPRYGASDIPHTASTDHGVPRHGRAAPRPPADTGLPLVSYYRGRAGISLEDEDRARALGVVRLAQGGAPYTFEWMPQALKVLDAVFQRDRRDVNVAEARAYALGWQDRPAEALAAFEDVLATSPHRESALRGAASMAEALVKNELAVDLWRRAVAVNPAAPAYRQGLTKLLIKAESWAEARRQADAWVALDPFSADARAALLACLLESGAVADARREFERIEALAPSNLHELRIRYERKLR